MTTSPGRGDRTSERNVLSCRPFRAFSLANQTGGCASLAPGYSLRPLRGLSSGPHDVYGRKEDLLEPTVSRVGYSQGFAGGYLLTRGVLPIRDVCVLAGAALCNFALAYLLLARRDMQQMGDYRLYR